MQFINPFLYLPIKNLGQTVSFQLAILTSGLDLSNGLTLSLQIIQKDSEKVVYEVPEQNIPVSETHTSDNFQITANIANLTINSIGSYIMRVECNGEVVEQEFTTGLEKSR